MNFKKVVHVLIMENQNYKICGIFLSIEVRNITPLCDANFKIN